MKIESYQQLMQAKAQTKLRILELEQQIRNDMDEIREDLKPLNLAVKTARGLLSSDNHGILSESIGMGINVLVKKVLFRNTGFIKKMLIAFAAKNMANNLVTSNSENILDWLQVHLRKLKSNHHHNGQHHYDASTAGGGLET